MLNPLFFPDEEGMRTELSNGQGPSSWPVHELEIQVEVVWLQSPHLIRFTGKHIATYNL